MTRKAITPFPWRNFPPTGLSQKVFGYELDHAHNALVSYSKALEGVSFPRSLFSLLIPLESIASLNSQKIDTSLKEVLLAEYASIKRGDKLKPIIDHIQALKWACKSILKMSIGKTLICRLHRKIKYGSFGKGSYRKKQNWIGPAGCEIEEAYFYPPAPKDVAAMMQELLSYCSEKKDPLMQLAVSFAQLLIIHPFMDGNGRIARMLIPLFLYRKKVIPFPFFFMSGYFKLHRLPYFQYLYQTTDENHWENWIIFFLKGVRIEVKRTILLLQKIDALYQKLHKANIRGMTAKHMRFLFQNPVFLGSAFKSKTLLLRLQHLKWLRRNKEGVFIFTPLFKILNSFLK